MISEYIISLQPFRFWARLIESWTRTQNIMLATTPRGDCLNQHGEQVNVNEKLIRGKSIKMSKTQVC